LTTTAQRGARKPGNSNLYDLLAFVAVLVVGVVLIALAHPNPVVLGAYATIVSGCYAAWRRRG